MTSNWLDAETMLTVYRRTKMDMLEQRGLPYCRKFLEFEKDLEANLVNLADKIIFGVPIESPGELLTSPKAQILETDDDAAESLVDDAAESLIVDPNDPDALRRHVSKRPRKFFSPSVELALLSGLWLERVAPTLEAFQTKYSFGNRLLLRRGKLVPGRPSFRSFAPQYELWRSRALKAAKSLAAHGPVEIVTFDLANCYASIEADFLLSPDFLLHRSVDIKALDPLGITAKLIAAIQTINLGLPIGLPASAAIANAALAPLDQLIQKLPEVHYCSRYVDDFIVVAKPGAVKPKELVASFRPEYLGTARFEVARGKTRRIKLDRQHADAFLAEMSRVLDHLSSERRAVPSDESLDSLSTLVVETMAGRSMPVRLRDSDVLTVSRYSLAVLLSSFRKLLWISRGDEWRVLWRRHYRRIASLTLGAVNLVGNAKYLKEVAALCLLCDEEVFSDFSARLTRAVDALRVYGVDCSELIEGLVFDGYCSAAAAGVVLGVAPVDVRLRYDRFSTGGRSTPDPGLFARASLCSDFGLAPLWDSVLSCLLVGGRELLSWCDESGAPPNQQSRKTRRLAKLLRASFLGKPPNHRTLLGLAGWLRMSVRRPSPSMLTILLRDDAKAWSRVVRDVCGVRPPSVPKSNRRRLVTPAARFEGDRLAKVVVSVGNIRTEDEHFTRAAQSSPVDVGARRTSMREALRGAFRDGADFCLFPELSVPRAAAFQLARQAAEAKTSTIMGLEYAVNGSIAINEVLLCLVDGRGQYWFVRQRKMSPANGERRALEKIDGLSFGRERPELKKRVYEHRGVAFSILICSELLNSAHRPRMRGEIDVLFVPAWNRDLQAFEALTASASLDIHCFVAVANNRKYGESMVRAPAVDEWDRVPIRVKGGRSDHFVSCEINVAALRKFQSRKRSPKKPFKPVPDGFQMARRRRLAGRIKGESDE